ncbi:MAG: GntR family transcriptional regulator [Ilumatobacteraceae bacterium]
MSEPQGSLGTFGVVESLADRAYSQLFRAILRNELAPGTPLSVPELAQRMSISRSPVREAVQRLIYDGLAEHVLHRGAVVPRIDEAGFHDLLDVRELLEGLAARLAARRIDHDQLDELGTTLAAQEATVSADDWYRSVELDIRFHAIIRTAACNASISTRCSARHAESVRTSRCTRCGRDHATTARCSPSTERSTRRSPSPIPTSPRRRPRTTFAGCGRGSPRLVGEERAGTAT